jgi:hypothetical protein
VTGPWLSKAPLEDVQGAGRYVGRCLRHGFYGSGATGPLSGLVSRDSVPAGRVALRSWCPACPVDDPLTEHLESDEEDWA